MAVISAVRYSGRLVSLGVKVVGSVDVGMAVVAGRLSVRLNEMGAPYDEDDDEVDVVTARVLLLLLVVVVTVAEEREEDEALVDLADPPEASPNIYAPAVSTETRARAPLLPLLSPPPPPPPPPPLPLPPPLLVPPPPPPGLGPEDSAALAGLPVGVLALLALSCCRWVSRKASVTEVTTTCIKSKAQGRPPCTI